jgi:hypothetical protein
VIGINIPGPSSLLPPSHSYMRHPDRRRRVLTLALDPASLPRPSPPPPPSSSLPPLNPSRTPPRCVELSCLLGRRRRLLTVRLFTKPYRAEPSRAVAPPPHRTSSCPPLASLRCTPDQHHSSPAAIPALSTGVARTMKVRSALRRPDGVFFIFFY